MKSNKLTKLKFLENTVIYKFYLRTKLSYLFKETNSNN